MTAVGKIIRLSGKEFKKVAVSDKQLRDLEVAVDTTQLMDFASPPKAIYNQISLCGKTVVKLAPGAVPKEFMNSGIEVDGRHNPGCYVTYDDGIVLAWTEGPLRLTYCGVRLTRASIHEWSREGNAFTVRAGGVVYRFWARQPAGENPLLIGAIEESLAGNSGEPDSSPPARGRAADPATGTGARHEAVQVTARPSVTRSLPARSVGATAPGEPPILEVKDLVKHFPVRSKGLIRRVVGDVHAVCGISFELHKGETLGVVGESGCGKSTTGRALLNLQPATSGEVLFEGRDVTKMSGGDLRALRRDLQIVFQDPYASLNPRLTVNSIVAEPLKIHGMFDEGGKHAGKERVRSLLSMVGLNPEHGNRYPHEFSGGQRQRVGIARALALEPKVLVLDEPVSALDVSIQAGVVNLLEELQERLGVAYLFIAHDLSVVRHIADRVAVMYLGWIVETASRDDLYEQPQHPYTQALMSATPIPDPVKERQRQRILLRGDLPNPAQPPSGCRFRTRCWKFADELSESQREACVNQVPELVDRGGGHPVACHYPEVRVVA